MSTYLNQFESSDSIQDDDEEEESEKSEKLNFSKSKINILVGSATTEDTDSTETNSSTKSNSIRKHFHNNHGTFRRQRVPPKKLEVKSPSAQEFEVGNTSKNTSNKHRKHRNYPSKNRRSQSITSHQQPEIEQIRKRKLKGHEGSSVGWKDTLSPSR